ncbi:hypothetical protein [Paraburkholderia terrae]|uniref:hypothetical protein n=1 Tax=Paraburkholderia terrae TaxID=311230 RepID=UPI00204C2926|nr:hypothetical protein [Paraburkholderia terrae]BDC45427.1 hypothetical protein PTKU15_87240 [Paraburkholderia terrae]
MSELDTLAEIEDVLATIKTLKLEAKSMHRSSKISRACAALALAALAGCNSKSDPTKENFTQAVQKHLDAIDPVCVVSGAVPFDLPHFEGSYAEKQADALVKVGLLSKESANVTESGRMIPGFHYSATDEGKKAFRPGNKMCGGKSQLQSITWSSSVPDKAEVGTTVDVKYAAKLVERPNWDEEAVLRPTHIELLSTNDGIYNAENILELTNDGWTVKLTLGTQ